MSQTDPRLVELAHQMFDLARNGAADQLDAHIEAGVPVDLTDANGNTLLMLAAYHGNAGTVRTLLGRGATVDALNDRGQSPLAGAVFKGEPDVVTALLRAGADENAGTPSARQAAAVFGQEAMLDGPADGDRPDGTAAGDRPDNSVD